MRFPRGPAENVPAICVLNACAERKSWRLEFGEGLEKQEDIWSGRSDSN